jgi:hypothetical protein
MALLQTDFVVRGKLVVLCFFEFFKLWIMPRSKIS